MVMPYIKTGNLSIAIPPNPDTLLKCLTTTGVSISENQETLQNPSHQRSRHSSTASPISKATAKISQPKFKYRLPIFQLDSSELNVLALA